MNDVVNFPNEKSKIINEACRWLAKLDARDLSQTEKAELRKWINQSDDHKRELTRLANIWDNIEAADLQDIPVEIDKSDITKTISINNEYYERPTKNRLRIFMSVAASLFVCLSIAIFLHIHELSQFRSTNGKYATDIGEQLTVRLSDGSEIRLNTNTLVEVNYLDGNRNIHLYKGEAHFDVAHDPEKPFTVKARKGEIRALGTVFSVRVKNNRVNVIVEEGKVRIRANENVIQSTNNQLEVSEDAKNEKIKKIMVVATAGKNVVFGEQEIESVIQEEKEAIERRFSWRQGMLAFDDEPLSDVIDEVSRYTSNKIIIADPAIRSLRVGGYYPIGKIQVIFDALELNLGVHIKQVDERTYYITYDGT